ncbi:MAG: biopolymer transporter ExbD [Phycisphaerales bacterium]
MRRVRRSSAGVRLELTPLIDVVFLLLTFFVFSVVLMVRADVLDVKLPELTAGRSAEGARTITVTIDDQGKVFVEGEAVERGAIGDRIREIRAQRGEDSPILLAVDESGRAGDLIRLADELSAAGLGEFSVLGRPSNAEGTRPGFVPTGPEGADGGTP